MIRDGFLTVGCEKLDPLFFLNNSLNIQHRTPEPPGMCKNPFEKAHTGDFAV